MKLPSFTLIEVLVMVGMIMTLIIIVLGVLLACAGFGGGAYLLYEWHHYLTPEGLGLQPTQLAQ